MQQEVPAPFIRLAIYFLYSYISKNFGISVARKRNKNISFIYPLKIT